MNKKNPETFVPRVLILFSVCWFYDNLNDEQFNEFLFLSREDKIKFIQKNDIVNQSKICSMK